MQGNNQDTKMRVAQDIHSIFDENELYFLQKCKDIDLQDLRYKFKKFIDDCHEVVQNKCNYEENDPFQSILNNFSQQTETYFVPECEQLLQNVNRIET